MDVVRKAQVLLALLEDGKADSRIVFGFYYRVHCRDRALAEKMLRETTVFYGLYARQRRRLKQLDKEIEEELAWKATSAS